VIDISTGTVVLNNLRAAKSTETEKTNSQTMNGRLNCIISLVMRLVPVPVSEKTNQFEQQQQQQQQQQNVILDAPSLKEADRKCRLD